MTGLVTYADLAVLPGSTYDYRVRADNGLIISSAWSNTATATTQPPAPTNLVATLVGWSPFFLGGPQVTLTWAEAVTPAPLTGFVVERASDGGDVHVDRHHRTDASWPTRTRRS